MIQPILGRLSDDSQMLYDNYSYTRFSKELHYDLVLLDEINEKLLDLHCY